MQILLDKERWGKGQRFMKMNMEEVAHWINKEGKTAAILSAAVLPEDRLNLRFKSSLRS